MNNPTDPITEKKANDQIAIGIDFGTSNSVMSGYFQSTLLKGPVSFNFPLTGSQLYPSIAFLDRESVAIRTGPLAYRKRITDSDNVISSVKRHITEPTAYVLSNQVFYNKDIVEAIISDFVHEVKLVDHEMKVGTVTITVPYHFGQNENSIILNAAEKALDKQIGYKQKIFILPEPVAASLATLYNLKEESFNEKIFLVYDIGGGTLDLTLIKITNTKTSINYEVLANDGISNFGGDDIDELLYNYVIKNEMHIVQTISQHQEILNKARLIEECKNGKQNLTFSDTYSFMCSNLFGIKSGFVDFELTRKTLNSILLGNLGSKRNMVGELSSCIERLYAKASICNDSVDYLVPIGGTSYIPIFHSLLSSLHPKANEISCPSMMDNFTLVSKGACIYSALKSDEIHETKLNPFLQIKSVTQIRTRVSHALYLEKYNGDFVTLVKANELSPASVHRRYYPSKFSQDGIYVDIGNVSLFQGHGESRKNKRHIGYIEFSQYRIYSHGRKLNEIPIDIEITATDVLVSVHCIISKGDKTGKDIEFNQIIHN